MAEHRHKRETRAFRFPRASLVAAPLASLATLGVVGIGVLGADVGPVAPASLSGAAASSVDLGDRGQIVSRFAERRAESLEEAGALSPRETARLEAARDQRVTDRVVARAKRERVKLWTTALLNLWASPAADARLLGEFEEGKKILVTGRSENGRVEVVVQGEPRWVSAGYLSDEKPEPGLGGTCSNGTSVPSGVSPNIKLVHQAVCAAFPEITGFGTFRSDGEHAQGIAVDIMVSGDRGWQVAEFVRENYSELGVSYVIYSQRIWSVERGGEGWRGMSDRGSTTANHYDHVHVTTY